MVDVDVGHVDGVVQRFRSQEVDGLEHEVHGGIELVRAAAGRHFRADDDVRAEGLGHVDRVVVAHAAVDKYLSFCTYRPEIEGNGHGGADGVGNTAGGPVFGLEGHHVGGHADHGPREVGETQAVLVAYAHGADYVADVDSVEEAVGHAYAHAGDSLFEDVAGGGAGCPGELVDLGVHLLQLLVPEVFVVVVEGNVQGEALAVLAQAVGDIGVGDLVGHHDGPVYVPHHGVHLLVVVSKGIQAGQHAAHARAHHYVYGDAFFLKEAYHPQVCKAAGAASGQHQRHGGTVPAYGVKAGLDLTESY